MKKYLLLPFILFTIINNGFSQTPGDSILKTYQIGDYTVKLIKTEGVDDVNEGSAIQETIKSPNNNMRRYITQYLVYKADSVIAILPYIEGECKLTFDERKKVKGFYNLTHTTILDICTNRIEKLIPPTLDWLQNPIDSITIYPLDSVLDPYNYMGQTVVISNYASRKPEALSEQNVKNLLFQFRSPRPLGFAPPSLKVIQHYKLVFYMGEQTEEIYLYYDMFFYQTWVYSFDYYISGSTNAAKKLWESHEAQKAAKIEKAE